jgi:uncharacterized protein (DUF885 family)
MNRPLLLPVLALTVTSLLASNPEFDRWAENLAADTIRSRPTQATSLQYFSGAEQDAIDRKLNTNSKEERAARVEVARRGLAELAAFHRDSLDAEQRISALVIEWSLKGTVDQDRFDDHDFVFDQFRGRQVMLINFLSQTHPIRNKRDIENYIARLEQVASSVDHGIEQARDAAARGFLMPDFITRSALGQFERFLANPPSKNIFVASLEERAVKLADVSADERAVFVAAAERITSEQIIPAFRRAQALLQEQLPLTKSDAGLWALPDGEAAYAAALRRYTTTDMTPDEIHALGLAEVARIEGLMDGLLRQLGFTEGTVKARYEQLNLSLQPPVDPDPRPGLIARYEEMLADAARRSEDVFDIRPKAPCVVKREPLITEKTAAAHYSPPARDGSRPGIFWAPLPGPVFRIVDMRTLTYHEAIPGHHFQIALQRETESLPRYRQDGIFSGGSAYSEGWALYAEQIAAEFGWYEGDTVGLLGQLNAELLRARRLVVDTGIHAKRWTRQQVIDYGITVQEAERYAVLPGQACAYKVGQLKILALRAKAKESLGDKFSIKEFHNVVLQSGNLPLAVLEQVIDAWVAGKHLAQS